MGPALLLRILSLAEGLSYFVLLAVAMPMKYLAGQPEWVSWTGRIHGGLFVALALAAFWCASELGWSWKKVGWVILWAIIPLGALHIERVLAAEARAEPST